MKQQDSEKHLTIQDVADRWGVTHVFVRGQIRRGHLEAIRIGSRWRVRQSDLERFEGERSNRAGVGNG